MSSGTAARYTIVDYRLTTAQRSRLQACATVNTRAELERRRRSQENLLRELAAVVASAPEIAVQTSPAEIERAYRAWMEAQDGVADDHHADVVLVEQSVQRAASETRTQALAAIVPGVLYPVEALLANLPATEPLTPTITELLVGLRDAPPATAPAAWELLRRHVEDQVDRSRRRRYERDEIDQGAAIATAAAEVADELGDTVSSEQAGIMMATLAQAAADHAGGCDVDAAALLNAAHDLRTRLEQRERDRQAVALIRRAWEEQGSEIYVCDDNQFIAAPHDQDRAMLVVVQDGQVTQEQLSIDETLAGAEAERDAMCAVGAAAGRRAEKLGLDIEILDETHEVTPSRFVVGMSAAARPAVRPVQLRTMRARPGGAR